MPRPGVFVALLGSTALLLVASTSSQAAEGAYEPNDSAAAASGPLLSGGTYTAAIERQGDRDLFYFYVTSPDTASVELSVANLGGSNATDLTVAVLESSMTLVTGESYIRPGAPRTIAARLQPQKYLIEVSGGAGFGDSYALRPAGGAGAFAPYAQVAGRCASARRAVAASRVALNKAQARLQHAIARRRSARYLGIAVRRRAALAHRKARRRLASERRSAREALKRQEPWCSIAP